MRNLNRMGGHGYIITIHGSAWMGMGAIYAENVGLWCIYINTLSIFRFTLHFVHLQQWGCPLQRGTDKPRSSSWVDVSHYVCRYVFMSTWPHRSIPPVNHSANHQYAGRTVIWCWISTICLPRGAPTAGGWLFNGCLPSIWSRIVWNAFLEP